MTYCDFDGKGKSARYVRLYLATPNTANWFRIYEIEVNGRQYEEANQGLAVDASGLTIEELTDAQGSTGYTPAATNKPGEVIWNLRSQQHAKSLNIYQDGAQKTDATVSVTTGDGQWEEIGVLSGYVGHFNLTSYPLAVAVKISWRSKAPLLYEITEETEDVTTSLDEEVRVKSDEYTPATGWYTLDGRKFLSPPTHKGLYIFNGKKVVVKQTR